MIEIPFDEAKEVLKKGMIADIMKALGLFKRVPELMKQRGWPVEENAVEVLALAVALHKLGARGTLIKRPALANDFGGLWKPEHMIVSAKMLVDTLELDDLLDAR